MMSVKYVAVYEKICFASGLPSLTVLKKKGVQAWLMACETMMRMRPIA